MAIEAPEPPHWAHLIAGLLRQEIDEGRLVRVALPGAKVPVLVEDAMRWGSMLALKDPQGARYYVADPAGVVVLAEPVRPVEGDWAARVDEAARELGNG